ncbi:MAG TPA: DedA family protein [Candidatus Babeliales bacterium]|nr:DedA family protein [Candidatus Babeliales bacterium]
MFNVNEILQAGGLLAVGAIVFAESGILLGLILPGDTLLLTAGLLAGRGQLPITWLVLVVIISAIAGYQVGYIFGERAGPRLFKRKEGILLREDYIFKTQKFFKNYGAATVILGRFVAHVRTLVSIIAGAANMDKREFFIFNVIGAVLWGSGITLIGYWLGTAVTNIDRYFFPILVVLLGVIYTFIFWQVAKNPERRRTLLKGLREDWDYFTKHGKNT